MVDFVTSKFEFIIVPRKKKTSFVCGLNHSLPFRNKLCSRKQICHGYKSLSIAYRLYLRASWYNRRGEVVT